MAGCTLESESLPWVRFFSTVDPFSIAEIDSCGRIKIVDRVKNVVKLSQGYVTVISQILYTTPELALMDSQRVCGA